MVCMPAIPTLAATYFDIASSCPDYLPPDYLPDEVNPDEGTFMAHLGSWGIHNLLSLCARRGARPDTHQQKREENRLHYFKNSHHPVTSSSTIIIIIIHIIVGNTELFLLVAVLHLSNILSAIL